MNWRQNEGHRAAWRRNRGRNDRNPVHTYEILKNKK